MIDPVSAYIVAEICLSGLKLAVKGLKGLFKWIRRWIARKLKLNQYIKMLDHDRDGQARMLADRLQINPEAWRKAQRYAMAVQGNSTNALPQNVEEDGLDDSDYRTGSEWDGESCQGSEVPDSDFELDENSDVGYSSDGGDTGSRVYTSSDEEGFSEEGGSSEQGGSSEEEGSSEQGRSSEEEEDAGSSIFDSDSD